ncbi:MAG: hypothetical protein K2N51_17085 [Lachnospiraceae bacterium]|nr:hypothetical protein [Lachnospiraceae bacterium]
MDTQSFITKDLFKNLAGCIGIVEALTEAFKLLLGDILHPYILWIAFACSIYVGLMRFFMEEEQTKEDLMMAILNVVIIFLGAVGTYQVGIKSLEKLILK